MLYLFFAHNAVFCANGKPFNKVTPEKKLRKCWSKQAPQLTFTCLKSTMETPEKFSMLTKKPPERHQQRRYEVFIVNFEDIPHVF